MDEIKVSQLPSASQINDADLLMIIQNNTNKKVPASEVANIPDINNHSVVVSPTEPSGSARKKVWLQKTKNLFNKKASAILLNSYMSTSELNTGVRVQCSTGGNFDVVVYILKDVTDYVGKLIKASATISSSSTNTPLLRLILCNKDGSNRKALVDRNNTGTIETTIPTLDGEQKYLALMLASNNSSTTAPNNAYVDYADLYVTMENEISSYEPYVEDKEYILNNNVYEEFNPNKEKVIDITSLSGGATINTTYWRNRLVKQGKICHLELAFAPNSTGNITILQLPTGFYSSGNTATIGLLMRNSLLGKMVITNGGAVQVQVGSESGNTWSLNATWIVD